MKTTKKQVIVNIEHNRLQLQSLDISKGQEGIVVLLAGIVSYWQALHWRCFHQESGFSNSIEAHGSQEVAKRKEQIGEEFTMWTSHRKRWKWNQHSDLRLSFNETVFDDAYFVSTFSCYRSGLFTEKLPLVLNEQPPTRGPAEPRTNSGNNFPGSKIPVKVDREVYSTFFFVMNGYFRFWGERGAWEWQDLDEERAFASSELEIRSWPKGITKSWQQSWPVYYSQWSLTMLKTL